MAVRADAIIVRRVFVPNTLDSVTCCLGYSDKIDVGLP